MGGLIPRPESPGFQSSEPWKFWVKRARRRPLQRMMNQQTNNLTIGVISLTLLIAGAARAANAASDNTPAPAGPTIAGKVPQAVIQEAGIKPKFGEQLPLEQEFVNADGKKIRLGDCF